ncbi:MAG: [Clostridia bacterium]|nr:[FeFe] hydrogenase H-cluster maturation GTPase HydF [Clostridia bacterium]
MSLNNIPSAERLHIGFFGRRNAGKSSLVNAVTGQELSVVSDVKGTTTDPVKKAMELLPLGPVVIIDTPGFDDEGELGLLRIKKTKEILRKTDIAVLVVDAVKGKGETERKLISLFAELKVSYVVVYNKCDALNNTPEPEEGELFVSAKQGINIEKLKEAVSRLGNSAKKSRPLIDDLITAGDLVILVTPIDASAPKGRIILPQQLTLRNILDNNCTAIVCKETELKSTLEMLNREPSLVITDSQVFSAVSEIVPENIRLTSFSIVFARYKGELSQLVKGAAALRDLNDGDRVLISEGCTHHRQCNDIGTVKIPEWIKTYTGKNILFDFSSGGDFPEKADIYKLVVHCGGCMLSEKEMQSRIDICNKSDVPVVNYGIAIAMMNGILERSLGAFPEISTLI